MEMTGYPSLFLLPNCWEGESHTPDSYPTTVLRPPLHFQGKELFSTSKATVKPQRMKTLQMMIYCYYFLSKMKLHHRMHWAGP